MDRLTKALDAAAKALQQQQSTAAAQGSTGQSPASGSPSGTESAAPTGSSGSGASAGAGGGSQSTASLAVEVLKATQALASAEQDLDAAVLKAPISGTVGQVDLVKGEPAEHVLRRGHRRARCGRRYRRPSARPARQGAGRRRTSP